MKPQRRRIGMGRPTVESVFGKRDHFRGIVMEQQGPYYGPPPNNQGGPPQHGQYYGPPPNIQYGPPPHWQQPPQKKSKLGWILGGVGVFVILMGVLLFAGCSALVSEINGGGGSHEEKAKAMVAAADNVPEDDWVLVGRSDPKFEPGCLSIDIECLRLRATWSVDHKVALTDAASRLGMDMSGAQPSGSYSGCIKSDPHDGNSTTSICINEDPKAEGTYLVSVNMTRR